MIWEIILRDFWRAILRSRVAPTTAGMEMPEGEHLNSHLFEASDHAIYRTRESAKKITFYKDKTPGEPD